MRIIYFCFAVVIFTACNDSGRSDSTKDTANETPKMVPPAEPTQGSFTGCYRQVIGRDSINLQLVQGGESFSGKLEFDNFEKDASHGTVKGYLENGRIVLWYDFFSEGTKSIMEIIFEPTPSGMVRGVGEMNNRGDTVRFNDHAKLTFDKTNTLLKTSCEN